jgi:glycosyltransferase involved in cell wall biosynthesis
MKKVILLNPWCPLVRNPRTLRMERVRKSLENDFEVSILCCQLKPISSLDERLQIHSSVSSGSVRKLWQVFKFCVNRLAFPDAYLFHSLRLLVQLWKYGRDENICVISFSPPFSTHLAAWIFGRFHSESYWIADTGDLYYKNPTSVLFPILRPMQRILQKELLCKADRVIFNSKSIQGRIVQESNLDQEKCALIYNGSSIDFSGLETIKEKTIRFLYAGSTYAKVREGLVETEILSETIAILKERGYDARMTLAGCQSERLIQKYSEDKKLEMISHCGTDELISLYRRADFLVSFSNGAYPGLPSKLSEYRASGLPIICFAAGSEEPSLDYLSDYEPCFPFILGKTAGQDLVDFILAHLESGLRANQTENQMIRQQWLDLLYLSDKGENTHSKE